MTTLAQITGNCSLSRETAHQVHRLPAGLRRPAIVQLWNFVRRPCELLDTCAARFGDVFTIQFPGAPGPMLVFRRPEHVRDIFRATPEQLCGGTALRYFFRFLRRRSIVTMTGDTHKELKQLISHCFSPNLIADHREAIRSIVVDEFSAATEKAPVDLRDTMSRVSLRLALQFLFGQDLLKEDEKTWQPLLKRFSTQTLIRARVYSAIRSRFIVKGTDAAGAACFRPFIESRAQSEGLSAKTIAARLLATLRGTQWETDRTMLTDILLTLAAFTFGTTVSTLEHAMYHLTREHDVRQQMVGELDGCQSDHVPPYFDAFGCEVRRLSPNTPGVIRVAQQPYQVGRFRLQPGTMVMACSHLAHRSSETFEEPNRFDPSRFLNRRYAQHEYFPFGAGIRSCLGRQLAPKLTNTVLADVLRNFDIAPRDAQENPVTLSSAITRHTYAINAMVTRRLRPGV